MKRPNVKCFFFLLWQFSQFFRILFVILSPILFERYAHYKYCAHACACVQYYILACDVLLNLYAQLMATIEKPYVEFSDFLLRYFDGKMQKLSVNAGFTCPNRDGTVGWGGCTYCNNQTFNPAYCADERSVSQQLEDGKLFFSKKYPLMRYLAYFQAYTNTYSDINGLRKLYEEALSVDKVDGIVIGTRPDCVSDELLDYLSELNREKFVLLEYGVESTLDKTLKRINRGHNFACVKDAVQRTAAREIPVGVHVILGLPGESRDEILSHADALSQLPINTLKLHQLQIVKGTAMAREFLEKKSDFYLYTADEYAALVVDFVERLRADIAVERFTSQSPKELLIAPDWGLKNYQFVEIVKKLFRERGTCQGAKCQDVLEVMS